MNAFSTPIVLFHFFLYSLLAFELYSRIDYTDVYYGPESTHPLSSLDGFVDRSFELLGLPHIWASQSTELFRALLWAQVFLAAVTALFPSPPLCATNWFLYFSLCLRNTWLFFILDRYFHFFLLISIFTSSPSPLVGVLAGRIQLLWIYLDAGYGKVTDPLRGWTTSPVPGRLPALDSYTRHTYGARVMYTLLGSEGLKHMTPAVAWAEVVLAPLAILASLAGYKRTQATCVLALMGLHVGIAMTLNNTVLLGGVACSALCLLLPTSHVERRYDTGRHVSVVSTIAVVAIAAACLFYELSPLTADCSQDTSILPFLLNNRWNVFTSSETYVTWEIAPGLLRSGNIVDIWSGGDVSYDLPGSGAPCTSTARRGRWRSFPYLKEPNSEAEKHALWQYLCTEWNTKNDDELLKFNFFMLQADVLPEMEFGPTIKRKIIEWDCWHGIEVVESEVEEKKNKDKDKEEKENENEMEREEKRGENKFPVQGKITKKTLGGYKIINEL